MCYGNGFENMYCFSRKGNTVESKKLFGEIYNEEYITTMHKYRMKYNPPADILYIFDNNNNMHLFYNDTEHAKGKYFNYVMFTEAEPTLPKYEQKIYRIE